MLKVDVYILSVVNTVGKVFNFMGDCRQPTNFQLQLQLYYFHKNKTSNNIKQRKPYGGVGWKANKACK